MNAKKQGEKKMAAASSISLTVNGQVYKMDVGSKPDQVATAHTLAHTLRETLGLTGTKVSCDNGACGCCTVLMDNKAVPSCLLLTIECDGKNVTTIEGLGDPKAGMLDPIQQTFIAHTAFQCGFCTPGIIMGAKALLNENNAPTEEEVKEALSGNFCRCISHYQVVQAVMAASGRAT
ncbi:MAG: (2Fe-2S)-binding protein [Deltaproteobacteria bacterium]|nr:(2Fe-2S)-binding protein [Deltaproteobacteria bacterium]